MGFAQFKRWVEKKRTELVSVYDHDPGGEYSTYRAGKIAAEVSRRAAALQLPELMRVWGEDVEIPEVDQYLVECLRAIPSDCSVAEVAKQLGVSKETIYAACRDGRLPHTRIGRRIVITPEQLQKYRQSAEIKLPHLV